MARHDHKMETAARIGWGAFKDSPSVDYAYREPQMTETEKKHPRVEMEDNEETVPVEASLESAEDLERELEEVRGSRLRLAADFENYKRHARKEVAEAKQKGRDAMVKELASLIGELEKAAEAQGPSEGDVAAGVKLTLRKLRNVLREFGYERIPTRGQSMNPAVHEAVAVVPAPNSPPGHVLDEVTPGFTRDETLVLPARVVVSRKEK